MIQASALSLATSNQVLANPKNPEHCSFRLCLRFPWNRLSCA